VSPEDFVRAITLAVHDPAVNSTRALIDHAPPGRTPPARIAALAAWSEALSPTDRAQVHETIQLAVHSAVFGFLCVLDGVRSVRNPDGLEPRFALDVLEGDLRSPLNPASGPMLHELYQREVYESVFGKAAE
jgi:hypothetical protein